MVDLIIEQYDIAPGGSSGRSPATPMGEGYNSQTGGLSTETLQRFASVGLASACLAHDMGNLLQVVASALRLMDRSIGNGADPSTASLCQHARAAVDRTLMLQRKILHLARAEPNHCHHVDPIAILSPLEGLIQLTLGPQICLDIDCAATLPHVACGAQDLENAVLNLVANARDAMPDGGRLGLSLGYDGERLLENGIFITSNPRFVLKVHDTGCGMSQEVLGRVFEPFFSTKTADRGTGLGLPMVAAFVRRVGGSIEIESRPGEGTTVALFLPGTWGP